MHEPRLDSDVRQKRLLCAEVLNLNSVWSALDTIYTSSANLNTLYYKCLITFQVLILINLLKNFSSISVNS